MVRPALFQANARPRRILVTASPRPPIEVELRDVAEEQRVPLPRGEKVRAVEVTVISVWPGTRYADMCISDLYVDGRP